MNLWSAITNLFQIQWRNLHNKERMLVAWKNHLLSELTSLTMDKVLEAILSVMSLLLHFNKEYQRQISGFRARYAFVSTDRLIGASAIIGPSPIFRKPRLKVKLKPVPNAHVTITFRDGKTLAEFLFTPNPDIFNALIENKFSFAGNFNYVLKFIYMARQIPGLIGFSLPGSKMANQYCQGQR